MLFNVSKKYVNDVHLSLAFAVLFTAYSTQSHIQKTLTISIKHDNPDYWADGYVSFGIIYTFVSLGMCLAPSIIALIGLKLSMVLGAVGYFSWLTFDYFENSWLSFVGSGITGSGAALLWTGQGAYVVLNSKVGSTYFSIGIFWIFYQSSLLIGNSFVYYLFNNPDEMIDRPTRQTISIILGSFVLSSIILFCLLGQPIRQKQIDQIRRTAKGEMKAAFGLLFKNKKLQVSIFIFIFCGLNLCFCSVLAASLGFSKYLSTNSKQFAPLSGVVQGVGEIAGCIFAVNMKRRSFLHLRVIPIGCILMMLAYVISFLGLPDSSAFGYTDEKPIIALSIHFFLLANLLCGIGDACIHMETYNYIGLLYPNNSTPAFAVFKFFRCISIAMSFYYSNYFGLRIQTTVLMTSSLLAIISYYFSMNKSYSTITVGEIKNTVSENESPQ